MDIGTLQLVRGVRYRHQGKRKDINVSNFEQRG